MRTAARIYPDAHHAVRRVVPRRAFTILELLVVIGIISLILVLGVPAFNTVSRDSAATQARQLLSAAMSRAALISSADRTTMAVRAVPSEWVYSTNELEDPAATLETTRGRQALVTYRYISNSTPPIGQSDLAPGDVLYADYFKETGGGVTLLPPDVWVAPSEALQKTSDGLFDGDAVLRGTVGTFALDPRPDGFDPDRDEFLNADDFLVVFEAERGVRTSVWPTNSPDLRPPAWRMYAYDPDTAVGDPENRGWSRSGAGTWNRTTRDFDIPYQRYAFGGLVMYRREVFLGLGARAASASEIEARRAVLSRGEAYSISRFGGNLLRSEILETDQ